MRSQRGSFLATGAFLSVAIAAMVIGASRIISSSVRQDVHLSSMNRAHTIAQSGLSQAAGWIVNNPLEFDEKNGDQVTVDGGAFTNHVYAQDTIVPSGYYVVTSATLTVNGREYATRLHTHLRVSNVSEYFAAVSDSLVISTGIDVGSARVYAPRLRFIDDGVAVTRVKSAEYVVDCTPAVNWSSTLKDRIQIAEPAFPDDVSDSALANQPKKLDSPLLLPQISDADMQRYQSLANIHTTKSVFENMKVFPPGYETTGCSPSSDDEYPSHTCDNRHHIYYSTTDMKVGNIEVYGQVLFIADGDIYITGNVVSADEDETLPGEGANASTAHQAIFITPNNVYIDNTYYPHNPDTGTQATQTIQALIFAPHGIFAPQEYTQDLRIHNLLSLDFTGSLILGSFPSSPPGNLASVFKGASGRRYRYMDSLKTNPPPYVPSIIDIFYSLEEVIASPGL